MYLVDASVLLHATIESAAHHRPATRWLDDRLGGRSATVGLPWHSLLGFVRTVSGRQLLDPPVGIGLAWRQVERWLDAPASWIPAPGSQHAHLIAEMVRGEAAASVSALHLAALALENGLTVASTDAAYRDIPHVRWFNPLVQRFGHP